MRTIYCFLLIICCTAVHAQQLEGKIMELHTRTGLAGVTVNNLTNGSYAQSDSSGRFRIPAQKGDLLTFHSFAYHPDTLFLTGLAFKEVFLELKQNQLKEITLRPNAINLGDLSHPYLHNQPVMFARDKAGNIKGGLVFRAFHHKDSRKERKAQARMADEAIFTTIDQVFNTETVRKYIPLEGTVLRDFIGLYRPTVKQFQSPGFNLVLYLNDCWKQFNLLPPDKRRLPPLPAFVP